jgi:DNA polymerase
MLIGQNPGTEEDKTGRPFVGKSGKFLDTVLENNGINRDSLFITNIVKHKTPGNRIPLKDEISACKSYILEQMKLIKPRDVAVFKSGTEGVSVSILPFHLRGRLTLEIFPASC